MPILPIPKTKPRVLLDGIFFLVGTGIGTVWKALFKELLSIRLEFELIVLSYHNAVPRIPEVIYLELPLPGGGGYAPNQLETLCKDLKIDLFISSYYSFPEKTPSLLVVYDCIPDVLEYDTVADAQWAQRKAAIEHASSYLTISNHTTFDLLRFYPSTKTKFITPSRLGTHFQTLKAQRPVIDNIDLDQPYLVFISAYKNSDRLFEALEYLSQQNKGIFQIVFTNVESDFINEVNQKRSYLRSAGRRFSEEELKWLYVHSAALVYPSAYEGFGLPVLDAVSCGGRVICGTNSSLPEAALDRAISVEPMDRNNLAAAILQAINHRSRQTEFPPNTPPSPKTVSWEKFTNDFLYATNLALDLASRPHKLTDSKRSGPPHSNVTRTDGIMPFAEPQSLNFREPTIQNALIRLDSNKATCNWLATYGFVSDRINEIQATRVLEVGVAYGYHAEYLLQQHPSIKYIGVDPYEDGYDPDDSFTQDVRRILNPESRFMDLLFLCVGRNLEKYAGRAMLLRQKSHAAAELIADHSLDLVYIDGDHRPEALAIDLSVWYPKLRVGGVFCGDDLNWAGSLEVIQRFFEELNLPVLGYHGSDGILVRWSAIKT